MRRCQASLADDGWQLCVGLQDRETRNPADPKVSRTQLPLSDTGVSIGLWLCAWYFVGLADPITDGL